MILIFSFKKAIYKHVHKRLAVVPSDYILSFCTDQAPKKKKKKNAQASVVDKSVDVERDDDEEDTDAEAASEDDSNMHEQQTDIESSCMLTVYVVRLNHSLPSVDTIGIFSVYM